MGIWEKDLVDVGVGPLRGHEAGYALFPGRLLRRRSADQGASFMYCGGTCTDGWPLAKVAARCGFRGMVISMTEWESTEESLELSRSMSLRANLGRGGKSRVADACASIINLSETVAYHSTMSGSGSMGRVSLGSMLGKGAPSAGFMRSNRLTAFCRNGTCSPGSRSN